MGSPSSSRSMSPAPLTRRRTPSAGSPSLKRTCPAARCVRVIAVLSIGNCWLTRRGQTSLPTSASVDASKHNIEGIYHLRNPRNTAAHIQALPSDAHLGITPYPDPGPSFFCRARPYAASRATSLDVHIMLEALARRGFLSVDRRASGRPAACRRRKPTLTIGRYLI